MLNKRVSTTIAMVVISMISVTILSLTLVRVIKPEEIWEIQIPSNYAKDYTEDIEGYMLLEEQQATDWETFEASPDLIVTLGTGSFNTQFSVHSNIPNVINRTYSDVQLITMNDNLAWQVISNGIFDSYPSTSYNQNAAALSTLKQTNTETITVDVWYWANPNDQNDFAKVTRQKTFAVNSALADLFTHVFSDIYNDPSQPVFNLADKGMGTWVLRGKNHNGNAGISAHALGAAIDINPSTGSLYVNGAWYGNGYGQRIMSAEMWNQLPESHTKYHIIYDGCPIAEIFKAYGFVWGGDWNSTKDPMHFSFLGDGSNAREKGIKNYNERN